MVSFPFLRRGALTRPFLALLLAASLGACPAAEMGGAPDYLVVLSADVPAVAPGDGGVFHVALQRNNGFTGAVYVRGMSSSGITYPDFTFAAGATTGDVTFTTTTSVALGGHTVLVPVGKVGSTESPSFLPVPIVIVARGTYALTLEQPSIRANPGMTVNMGFRVARNGMGQIVTMSATAPAGVTAIISSTTLFGNEEFGTVELRLASNLTTGPTYFTVVLRSVTAGLPDQTRDIIVVSSAGTFAISLFNSTVVTPQNTTTHSGLRLIRNSYGDPVILTSSAPAGVTVRFNASTSDPDEFDVRFDLVGTPLPGTYPVTIQALGYGTSLKTAVITEIVVPATTGAPASIVLTPASGSLAVNGNLEYTAVLLDAQGYRTDPGTGGSITITSVAPTIANVNVSFVDNAQRARIAYLQGVVVGTTQLQARYVVNGVTVFGPVSVPITVTP